MRNAVAGYNKIKKLNTANCVSLSIINMLFNTRI